MTVEPVPDWLRPPPDGFTADDLDRLAELPRHSQLIDGSLVFAAPQTEFHSLMGDLLERRLRLVVPNHLRVRRQMTVILGPRQRPEVDLIVLDAGGITGLGQTTYQARDVRLAIEVVSGDSEERDRKRKPLLYAEADIPYFWLVEEVSGRPAVYVYEMDPVTRAYVPAGIHRGRLKLTVPFDIDIDLTEIDDL